MKNDSLDLFRKRNILHRLKAGGRDEGGGEQQLLFIFLCNDL